MQLTREKTMAAAALSPPPTSTKVHVPVMAKEVLAYLCPRPGAVILDGTLGGGGHAALLLAASLPGGQLLGLDRDEAALAAAAQRLAPYAGHYLLRQDSFSRALEIMDQLGWAGFDAVLLDLGLSSLQLEAGERGFSFLRPGPLDMRTDRRQAECAADIVNRASEAELKRILRDFGEERAAGVLARALVRARGKAPVTTTTALVATIEQVSKRTPHSRIHPATRVFQALRIAVNRELDHLAAFLREGYRLLRPRGRMVIIAYHSLEDRLVKEAFRCWAAPCLCPPQVQVCRCGWSPQVRVLTSKPLRPSAQEVSLNPRARSARLRAVEKCEGGR